MTTILTTRIICLCINENTEPREDEAPSFGALLSLSILAGDIWQITNQNTKRMKGECICDED